VATFPHQIGNDPVILSNLQIINFKITELRVAQTAPEEYRKYGLIALPAKRLGTAASDKPFPSSAEIQFPERTPSRLTPFTRAIPAAKSGLSRPVSEASKASRRIAANRKLIVEGAYRACSRNIRYRNTTTRLNASRGSEQYQSMNSSIA
jgi:hypothetical protein